MIEPKSALITGASSGIGAALARTYAEPGFSLFLLGRDETRLSAVAQDCRSAGAAVSQATIDVTDEAALAGWIQGCDAQVPLDLVIANAGISAGTGGGEETEAQARRIFATNLDGVLNTVLPAVTADAATPQGPDRLDVIAGRNFAVSRAPRPIARARPRCAPGVSPYAAA